MVKPRAEEWWTSMMIPLQSLEFRMLHFQRKQNQNPLAWRGWPSPFCHVSSLATRLPWGLEFMCISLDNPSCSTSETLSFMSNPDSYILTIVDNWGSYSEDGDEKTLRSWLYTAVQKLQQPGAQMPSHAMQASVGVAGFWMVLTLVIQAESPIKAASYDNC